MGAGSSDLVRAVAAEKYLQPAILAGKTQFSVAVKDIMRDLLTKGFPPGNYPQICTAIRTGRFLRENRIEIESVDGPPSGLSPRVVVHYRVAKTGAAESSRSNPETTPPSNGVAGSLTETSAEKAERLVGKLQGLLHEEYKEYGGADGFIRWVRGWDEDESGQ